MSAYNTPPTDSISPEDAEDGTISAELVVYCYLGGKLIYHTQTSPWSVHELSILEPRKMAHRNDHRKGRDYRREHCLESERSSASTRGL
jgi:hypothetical protein